MRSLIELCNSIACKYKENEPLCRHTTFKIGGNADILILPENINELYKVTKHCLDNNIRFFILGNGSNTVFDDKGYRGAVISLSGGFKDISLISENKMKCGSAAMLVNACTFARDNDLSGLEELYGIPGTVGGAVYMNAGAYGGEIASSIECVEVLEMNSGEIKKFQREECDFGYRKSIFMNDRYIILSAVLKLNISKKAVISEKMNGYMARRREKQPLEFPSAGSVFKRPEGYFAGALIEQCGLKGYNIGGAMVSEKHAGFIVNTGNASCDDVIKLVNYIKKEVKCKFGVELECEIKPIPEK